MACCCIWWSSFIFIHCRHAVGSAV